MWRNKATSFISIFGLTLGVTAFLLLATYILNELRYDRFHHNADRIAYVGLSYQSPNDEEPVFSSNTPTGVVPSFQRMFSEVEKGTRVYANAGPATIKYGEKLINEPNLLYADSTFFDIFTFHFIAGNASHALQNPNTIVLTSSTAKKYFDKEDPIGKRIEINGSPWVVTGVIADIPSFSQLQFNMLGSYQTLARSKKEAWNAANDVSYLLLKSPDHLKALQQKIDAWVKQENADAEKAGFQVRFFLEKLTDVHLHSKVAASGNMTYIYILTAIACSLLIIACVNFTNFITAKSMERAHEIGVKKVLGAQRRQVIHQFMLESALVTLVAIAIGVLCAYLFLPNFNQLIDQHLTIQIWKGTWLIYALGFIFLVITLISGTWPALIISAFKPVNALQGKVTKNKKGEFIRKALVTFQFTISLLFIIATLIAERQLRFIRTTDTGLNRSQVLVLDASKFQSTQLLALKNRLLVLPNIQGVTASYDSPVNVQGGYSLTAGIGNNNQSISITAIPIEKDFTQVFDLHFLAGEPLTQADIQQVLLSDAEQRKYSFIVNRLALSGLGWTPDQAIGKAVSLNGRKGIIKAVVQDFNFTSLREQIKPIVLFPEYDWFGKLFVKIAAGKHMARQLTMVEQVWKEFNPNIPFDYHFLDQEYNRLYQSEIRALKILHLFSVTTIIVSCLGLFGLATFVIQQRIKEVGIRKILGASVASIVRLLLVDFIKLVLFACIIASPIAWLVMHYWLNGFAYHIAISWSIFAMAFLLTSLITLFTVGMQAIRAAIANPVDSLRSE